RVRTLPVRAWVIGRPNSNSGTSADRLALHQPVAEGRARRQRTGSTDQRLGSRGVSVRRTLPAGTVDDAVHTTAVNQRSDLTGPGHYNVSARTELRRIFGFDLTADHGHSLQGPQDSLGRSGTAQVEPCTADTTQLRTIRDAGASHTGNIYPRGGGSAASGNV